MSSGGVRDSFQPPGISKTHPENFVAFQFEGEDVRVKLIL
jgi:hypothetical protein